MPSELHPHPALKVQGRFLFPCVGHSGAPVDNRAWTACMRGGSLALPSRRLDPPGDAADVNIAARARDAADNVGGTREDGVHGLMLTLQLHSVRPAAVEHEGLVRVGYTGRRHPRLAVRCGDRARSLRQRLRHQGHSADREASQGSGETCCPRGATVRRTFTWRAARRRPNIPVLFPPNHTTSTELSRVKANFVSPTDQRSFSRHVQPCAPAAGFERRGRGRTRCWHRWCAVLRARLRALCGHGSA